MPSEAVGLPHCPTCSCGQTLPAPTEWRRYSVTTTAERQCRQCREMTIMPGRYRWYWRFVPAKGSRRSGRASESLCPACYQAQEEVG